jgi:hypothetical protein
VASRQKRRADFQKICPMTPRSEIEMISAVFDGEIVEEKTLN